MIHNYYSAGYFIVQPKPLDFGTEKGKITHTCSDCINTLVFDFWCMSFADMNLTEKNIQTLQLTKEKIQDIRNWTDLHFNDGLIGYGSALPSLDLALSFKNIFFEHISNVGIYSIYFSESETIRFLEDFKNDLEFSMKDNLLKKHIEINTSEEHFIGYDFIGIDAGGSFHSFYCHDIAIKLTEKFSLKRNLYGLFEAIHFENEIIQYLNAQETGLTPVPWYIVKVKQITL